MNRTVAAQRAFFQSGATLPYAFRVKQLKTLYGAIKQNEAEIMAALEQDLEKGPLKVTPPSFPWSITRLNTPLST